MHPRLGAKARRAGGHRGNVEDIKALWAHRLESSAAQHEAAPALQHTPPDFECIERRRWCCKRCLTKCSRCLIDPAAEQQLLFYFCKSMLIDVGPVEL